MGKGLLAIAAGLLMAGCVIAAEPYPVAVGPPPPPPPRVEYVPVAPGPAYVWVPGYWQRHGRAYTWRSGHWGHRAGWRGR
jgi:hypothetical protein